MNGAFDMKILAIDFSSSLRSVALADAGDGNAQVLGRAEERHGQSTHAFAMIEKLLADSGNERGAIDCLAIGLGPGSYAGIRVSLAIAQGWQLARGVKTIGVSSVAVLAHSTWTHGQRGQASFVIDAQRGEFYLADYQLNDSGCVEVEPLAIVAPAQIENRLAGGHAVFGPDVSGIFPGARDLYPDAARLAEVASRKREFASADQLTPIYLRAARFVKAPKPTRSY